MPTIPEPLDIRSEIQPTEVKWPPAIPTDTSALKLVVQDAERAETWRQNKGVMTEWSRADRLYHFKVPQQFWEGTLVARASLGVPLVYEHVESLLPQIVGSLFADTPPFMIKPRPGTSMQAARAMSHLLEWELERINFAEEIRLVAKSCLLYGTGIAKWGWTSQTNRIRRIIQPNPQDPDETAVQEIDQEVSLPTFESLDLRRIFVDPSLRVPDIRQARFIIHQVYMTLQELDDLRDMEGYDIPARTALQGYFFPPQEVATTGIDGANPHPLSLQNEFTQAEHPSAQVSVNPLLLPLEVLEYWTADQVITVLQRKLVIRNVDNEFGVLPFVSCAFSDVLDGFYGLGLGKLIGGEQQLQQGIINARLDDLSLRINGMFVRLRGSNSPTQQVRMRPGGVIDVDKEGGVTMLDRGVGLPEAFAEVNFSDQRAQRRSGASEFVVQGSIPQSGTSSLVTAGGVNALASGAGARIQYFIERQLAGLVFVPTLNALLAMTRERLAPSQVERILSEELGVALDDAQPLDILNANVDFSILAATKLQARRAMAATLPTLIQFLVNEPVMSALAEQGKKINFEELVNMLFDVSAWPNQQNVVVAMSDEDTQRNMLNNPAIQQMLAGQAQGEQDSRMIEEKAIAQSGRDIIKQTLKQSAGEGA